MFCSFEKTKYLVGPFKKHHHLIFEMAISFIWPFRNGHRLQTHSWPRTESPIHVLTKGSAASTSVIRLELVKLHHICGYLVLTGLKGIHNTVCCATSFNVSIQWASTSDFWLPDVGFHYS